MNPHCTYFLILAASLAGPLLLSFDKKVSFYKNWKFFFPATILPAVFYIVWDIIFTKAGVWSFNAEYISGIFLSVLPIEEVLFFFVVPYCCVFIYECIRVYFPAAALKKFPPSFLLIAAAVFFISATFFLEKAYTFYTLLFNALFFFTAYRIPFLREIFLKRMFWISYAVILIPFLLVNGLLTAIPVVLYNDFENLALRIYTIPAEDVLYGLLLIMMNVAGFEFLRASKSGRQ